MHYPETLFGIPETVIMDPVHGGVPIFKHELKILRHPLLQRLRRLKQNDLTEYVFPGATHTRFHHSLGVMHVAGRCFHALVNWGLMERRKPKSQGPLSTDQEEAIQYFYFVVRAAALLHDVGHGPFSHEFEKVDSIKSMFEREGLFDKLWNGLKWNDYIERKPPRFIHEMHSIRIALSILEWARGEGLPENMEFSFGEDPLPFEISDAIGIMDKAINPLSDKFKRYTHIIFSIFVPNAPAQLGESSELMRKLLRSILAGTVNADTMDWLLRDSHYTGSKYGVFNIDHLIAALRPGYTIAPGSGQIASLQVAIAEKGIGAFEDFVFSRISLYRHVYSHKAVVGFKILLNHGIGEALRDPIFSNRVAKALSDIKHFRYFDDEQIIGMFKEIALTDADSACADLLDRKKLKHLGSYKNLSVEAKKDKIRRAEAEYSPSMVLSKETVVHADPTEEGLEMIRVLAKSPNGRRELVDMPAESFNLYKNYFNERKLHIYATKASWLAGKASTIQKEKPQPGYLISALGIPCCGKSTVMRHLAANLGAQYFREPEEIKWPTAVLDRERVGYLTAITWFRSMRVPHLYHADMARKAGNVAVIDSYYDKVMHYYLGKDAMKWLMPSTDPYFALCRELARIDEEQLPNVDLLVLFRVDEGDWRRFIKLRSRDLDNNEDFRNSFAMQEYFFDAAQELAKKRNIKIHEFKRKFEDGPTPIQNAAAQLYSEIRGLLPEHLRF